MSEPIQILLVEDNEADVVLTRHTLADSKVLHSLHVVGDGEQAMAFLRQHGQYARSPRPDLVLLDLNLPGKDGREVLEEIKSDPALKRIPVVVVTSSPAEEDILRSYDSYANAFVTKPVDLSGVGRIVKSIEEFWFAVVKLPPRE
ncbi:MAG: response regulator [Bryobacteraceae bacterium]